MLDWEIIVADLETLHRAASDIDGWNKKQTETFIRVGEWGLALNGISYAYLNSGRAMPTDLFEIFERLAVEMDMEEDPEFEGVAQLRAGANARPGSGVPNLARAIVPGGPTIVEQSLQKDNKDVPPAEAAKPREAGLSDERRKYVLDGDRKGGGHEPGRNTPGKSRFPSDWSDEKTTEAILDVANDPASTRRLGRKGRMIVKRTRDGVDIEVVIDQTGKSIISAYPMNIPENLE